MPTPVDFMRQYRTLRVQVGIEESSSLRICRPAISEIELRMYFMMNWTAGTDEFSDYRTVTSANSGGMSQDRTRRQALHLWFNQNRQRIETAAMGKGAPQDYQLALEWAVRSGKVPNPNRNTIQGFCNAHLGIDCSGFATNYLVAAGKRSYSAHLVRNTPARSYYSVAQAVNDPSNVQRGDLLVWMTGNQPKNDPGHVAIVQDYVPASQSPGNLHVVEATGTAAATPKLLDSWYSVERVITKNDSVLHNEVMILQVKRHGVSGSRVAVIRPV